jgi:hypothetical protein
MLGKSLFSGWREWRVAQDTEFGKVGFVEDFDHFSLPTALTLTVSASFPSCLIMEAWR